MTTATDGVEYLTMATQGDRAADGQEIRTRREALGLSQAELAVASDVGERTLIHIEHGSGGHTRIERVRRTLDRLERGEDPKSVIVRRQIEPGVWITLEVDETVATIRAMRRGEDVLRGLNVAPDNGG